MNTSTRMTRLANYERARKSIEKQYREAVNKKNHNLAAQLLDKLQRLNGSIVMVYVEGDCAVLR